MTEEINDGGPAFPPQIACDADGIYQEVSVYGVQSGMSLRDYFAAKAMQALCMNPSATSELVAQAAYLVADAMLKERAG